MSVSVRVSLCVCRMPESVQVCTPYVEEGVQRSISFVTLHLISLNQSASFPSGQRTRESDLLFLPPRFQDERCIQPCPGFHAGDLMLADGARLPWSPIPSPQPGMGMHLKKLFFSPIIKLLLNIWEFHTMQPKNMSFGDQSSGTT